MWQWVSCILIREISYNRFDLRYHTFCLELPGVPNTPEWMCPLCEVDQLSADENLYDDSDLEELQHILYDDTLNATGSDAEVS